MSSVVAVSRVLVIAAHPDDEVLGCFGTIARHSHVGKEVQVLIVAEGATSRQAQRDRLGVSDEISALAVAAQKAGSILCASGVELLDLPNNRMNSVDHIDLIKLLDERVNRYQPQVVYMQHVGDVNADHRRLHEAVVTACRPTSGHFMRRLNSFEVASSTKLQPPGSASAFKPKWFVDISDQWQQKREALEAYASEMRPCPHAGSLKAVEHLSRWRGAQVGVKAAEAFYLLRQVG